MSRLAMLLVMLAAFAACSKDTSPKGLCERGCKKLLGCANAGDDQLDPCISACMAGTPPAKDDVAKLEDMSCAEIAASAGGPSGGGMSGTAAPAAPTGPAGNGCTADCRGCVGDGTSCYAAAGGANGIPCEACCCAPGGPAPTWKTE
jgi:hypothetical protein